MCARCPTCGQVIVGAILDPSVLLAELQDGRDVYKSERGTWHLTRTRNVTVAAEAVYELLKHGKIVKTYSNCEDSYRIGRTIDIEATIEARKQHGKKAPLVFTDQ